MIYPYPSGSLQHCLISNDEVLITWANESYESTTELRNSYNKMKHNPAKSCVYFVGHDGTYLFKHNYHSGYLLIKKNHLTLPGIILWICPANKRWCYNVTLSLIGWAHTHDPCTSTTNLNILSKLGRYNGCWCPGFLHRFFFSCDTVCVQCGYPCLPLGKNVNNLGCFGVNQWYEMQIHFDVF